MKIRRKQRALKVNINTMKKYADIFRIGDFNSVNKEKALKFYKMAI